jgi:hypothetical protein
MLNLPCRSEKFERDESLCGVNSKEPKRIEFPKLGDEGAGGDAGGVDEASDDMVGSADDESCANRVPTEGANCRGYSSAMPSIWGLA